MLHYTILAPLTASTRRSTSAAAAGARSAEAPAVTTVHPRRAGIGASEVARRAIPELLPRRAAARPDLGAPHPLPFPFPPLGCCGAGGKGKGMIALLASSYSKAWEGKGGYFSLVASSAGSLGTRSSASEALRASFVCAYAYGSCFHAFATHVTRLDCTLHHG